MRPSLNRRACEKHRRSTEITILVSEICAQLVGAGSVLVQLKSCFARGAWRKDFDSYTECTVCDKTDVRGNVDGGVDDARLFAFLVEEQGERSGSACVREEGEVVVEEM